MLGRGGLDDVLLVVSEWEWRRDNGGGRCYGKKI